MNPSGTADPRLRNTITKDSVFLVELTNYQLLRKDSAHGASYVSSHLCTARDKYCSTGPSSKALEGMRKVWSGRWRWYAAACLLIGSDALRHCSSVPRTSSRGLQRLNPDSRFTDIKLCSACPFLSGKWYSGQPKRQLLGTWQALWPLVSFLLLPPPPATQNLNVKFGEMSRCNFWKLMAVGKLALF
jgi:hypothetical protein